MIKIIRLSFLACFSQCILRTFSLDSLIFTIDLPTFYHDCRSLIRFAAYYLSSRRLRVLLQRMVVNIVALLFYVFRIVSEEGIHKGFEKHVDLNSTNKIIRSLFVFVIWIDSVKR